MFTDHKRVLALALPMILSNITVPLLGLVDTAVIGHLANPAFLGGVAVGNMLVTFLFWLLGFLRMATTGLIAQAHGRGDGAALAAWLGKAGAMALALAAALLLLQWPLGQLGLWLSGASGEVKAQAALYFYARIWGAPAVLVNLVLLGFLVGRQDTRGPMALLILGNSLNILLDLMLVVGLGWQVRGAALASVVADYATLGLGLWLVHRRLPDFDWRAALGHSGWRRLLSLNRDILLRSFCLQLCFVFITFQGARMGDQVVAANAVLLNFLLLISYALDGIAYAAEALTGRAVGQGDEKALRYWVRLCGQWSLAFALAFVALFGFFGEGIIALLTDLPAVRQTAAQYLGWVVALPLVALWCYLFDGVFIGATRGRAMRNSMVLSTFGVFFPVWWLAQGLGNHGLWLALTAFMAMRGLSLWWLYRRPGFVSD
ncbi:MATE family efflux transporter DinF [Gallaecimonas xiamenensis]|uniref:DNA-damage-inducible protein F n=1 Tax=Gallaecimonas xiamenensis 3-C-1 TaxID=745411 RepID=K2K3H7_9GAMM|nr:MATE family efflux transporter DinF [Gallaecimonas xiamenensis]EKE77514.1 DNA-damage-inducible protein F [Gallaecimonas xiamenensis 3-C-1]